MFSSAARALSRDLWSQLTSFHMFLKLADFGQAAVHLSIHATLG
jgi:hypothetical protein